MTATDATLLLRACRLNPDEDAPRLILADAIQSDGFDGAAAYIRESVAHGPGPTGRAKRRYRIETARGYMRWLESLFGIPPTSETYRHSGVGGGEGWDQFHWRAPGDNRTCRFDINRGLPFRVSITCPMLMERAAQCFLFPLTHVFVVGRKPELVPAMSHGEYTMERHFLWVPAHYPQRFSTWEEERHHLPLPLYDRLAPDEPGTGHRRAHYPLASRAVNDLNRAALAFGTAAISDAEKSV